MGVRKLKKKIRRLKAEIRSLRAQLDMKDSYTQPFKLGDTITVKYPKLRHA